ncbi:MAG: CoA transferase [Deltaproteobacteria bacterium]|nr:CoA transferase [Deltaproteobacteria bacterium]
MAEVTPQLEGITVLNLASVGPAARAARNLADYGARVVQVSPTLKKGAKQIQPPFHSYGAGRGLERIQIDLKSAGGRAAFLDLAAKADVLIESYRPGVVNRLGIGFEDVRAVNPRIIYCSTTGYGQDGPAAGWAGHDINYLAMTGFLACTEPRPDGGPPIPGATVADSAGGGLHAVVAILAALVRRSMGGDGQYLDVSAAEGVLSLMSLSLDQFLATDEVAGPRQVLLTGRYAFYDVYPCRDGKWISVGAIEPRFYRNLCQRLDLEQYAEQQMQDEMQDEIRAAFREVFLTRERDDWVAELAPNDTCVAPVYEIPEIAADPHFRERRIFMDAEHEEEGKFRQVGPILAGGVREQPIHRVRPLYESDAPALLEWVGYSAEEIERLREDGEVE